MSDIKTRQRAQAGKGSELHDLQAENQALLQELEQAYLNMEVLLNQAHIEKEIAYQELHQKFDSLEKLYAELSQKENMLIHLEKLSSIGQFIAEILHELSNPLTAISGNAQLALMGMNKEKIPEYLRIILQNTQRMSGYLTRFKEMAYKGDDRLGDFDLNDSITEAMETIRILCPKNIRLQLDLTSDPLPAKGDPYQLHQIYLNLAKNAFDAMKDEGNTLKFSSRKASKEWMRGLKEGGAVQCLSEKKWNKLLGRSQVCAVVDVADNGCGIPAERLEKIFEAFYTTKGRGKGSGLGLSISSDIIKRHGGSMAVKSDENAGTTFHVIVPLDEWD